MKSLIPIDKLQIKNSIKLDSGEYIDSCEVAFKTYGTLNKKKTNAILVCHALSGDQFCSDINPITKNKAGGIF